MKKGKRKDKNSQGGKKVRKNINIEREKEGRREGEEETERKIMIMRHRKKSFEKV